MKRPGISTWTIGIALCTLLVGTWPARSQIAPQGTSSSLPPVVIKLFTEDMVVLPDHTSTSTQHWELQASNSAAAAFVGQQTIRFSDTLQEVTITEAYTLKADGRKLPVDTSAIYTRQPQGAPDAQMFDDQRERVIVFPNVEAGDTVVYGFKRLTKESFIPGQINFQQVFSPLFAFDEARISLTVPKSVAVNVEAHDVDSSKEVAADTTTYHWHYTRLVPESEETGVLSPLDHWPRIYASSMKDDNELGHIFAGLFAPHTVVTPKIQAEADDITKGITVRREQARAIYEWVSTHIRYVGVEIGTGTVIPHDAETVLTNGYGDCKDHSALFVTLLKAKGISGEVVLINAGNAYSLPVVADLGEINHAITWLPEFGLYADTTAGVAPFGVLPFFEYGKPVIHATLTGVAVHTTPVLGPDIATSTVTVTAALNDQGLLTGQAVSTGSGPFGVSLREIAKSIDAFGSERAATQLLRSSNTQGSGDFDVPRTDDFTPSYSVTSHFSLGPYPDVMAGRRLAFLPSLSLLAPPGDTLVGPLSNLNIKDTDPTACYSGHAVQDITLKLPAGRTFADVPPDTTLATQNFSYTSHWSLVGGAMTLHRELTSKVSATLCTDQTRKDAARMLDAIRRSLSSAAAVRATLSPEQSRESNDLLSGSQALQRGDYDEGIRELSDVIDHNTLTPVILAKVYAGRAAAYLAKNDPVKAMDDLNASIKLDPDDPTSNGLRGHLHLMAHDFDDAISDLSKSIKARDTTTSYYVDRGLAYAGKRDYTSALADDASVVRLSPDTALGHNLRASVFLAMNDMANYRIETDKEISLNPNSVVVLKSRAEVYFHAGRPLDAIQDYDRILNLEPNAADILNERGGAKGANGDYVGALADIDAALKLDPDHKIAAGAPLGRAVTLYALGRYSEAADAAKMAVDSAPSNPYPLLWMHIARLRLKQDDQADFSERAQGIDHGKWPWPILAFFTGQTSQDALEAEIAKSSIADKPGQTCEVAFYIGDQKLLAGDVTSARPLLQLALDTCPPDFTESEAARFELKSFGASN